MELLIYRMDSPIQYKFRVKGHLDETLADWFEGFTISNLEDGDALLAGPIQDQAALYGILNRISNLGLVLVSVNVVAEEDGTDEKIQPHEDDVDS